MVFSKRN